jgi:D-beta-D-heptose 7-phosphate kinase/D-beta-D-heptose 1-phosphate adenosyltransferase
VYEKSKLVAVSGGFDPLHPGHLELMQRAKALAGLNGRLVVILNNDNWLRTKKGYVFFTEEQRAGLIRLYPFVSWVVVTQHTANDPDMSVCRELQRLQPDIFANGGDREAENIPEYILCEELGIEMVFNLGEKIESSSDLVHRAAEAMKTFRKPWGFYQVHANPARELWALKTLHLNPEVQLSVQRHRLRSERWMLVEGVAWAGLGRPSVWTKLVPFKTFLVPFGRIHTLRSGRRGAVLVEVISGQYDENDIIRYEDIYGRV